MAKANGSGSRTTPSWIEAFVASTDNLESPPIFRRWAAISTIAAVLEQKVWMMTSSPLYPNMYVFLVGHPGVGKTRTIRASKSYALEVPEFHVAPTSLTAASLVDALVSSKRTLIRHPDPAMEYNSMLIAADELGAFMHEWDNRMIGVLSAFYDPDPYGEQRRGNDIKIKIKSPQLSILCGTTPSNLLKLIPEGAWDQGFTSRALLVFSDERIVTDIFNNPSKGLSKGLVDDLKTINGLHGQFSATKDYQSAINNWRGLGNPPVPTHPRLVHYNTRRLAHVFKLSMVSAIDHSNTLLLTVDDFNRALGWLIQAEELMPEIFKAGAVNADAKAMEEIYHFVILNDIGQKGVAEGKIVREASKHVPSHSVMRVLELMERGGMIKMAKKDPRTGLRTFNALARD